MVRVPGKTCIAFQRINNYIFAQQDYERRQREADEAYARMLTAMRSLTDYDRKVFDKLAEEAHRREDAVKEVEFGA